MFFCKKINALDQLNNQKKITESLLKLWAQSNTILFNIFEMTKDLTINNLLPNLILFNETMTTPLLQNIDNEYEAKPINISDQLRFNEAVQSLAEKYPEIVSKNILSKLSSDKELIIKFTKCYVELNRLTADWVKACFQREELIEQINFLFNFNLSLLNQSFDSFANAKNRVVNESIVINLFGHKIIFEKIIFPDVTPGYRYSFLNTQDQWKTKSEVNKFIESRLFTHASGQPLFKDNLGKIIEILNNLGPLVEYADYNRLSNLLSDWELPDDLDLYYQIIRYSMIFALCSAVPFSEWSPNKDEEYFRPIASTGVSGALDSISENLVIYINQINEVASRLLRDEKNFSQMKDQYYRYVLSQLAFIIGNYYHNANHYFDLYIKHKGLNKDLLNKLNFFDEQIRSVLGPQELKYVSYDQKDLIALHKKFDTEKRR